MKKIRQHLLPITVFVLFILIAVISYGLWKLDKKNEEAKARLAFLQQEFNKLDKLQQQYQSSQENVKKLEELLPADFYDFANIVEDLIAVAKLSNLTISLQIEDQVLVNKKEDMQVLPVSVQMTLAGRFQDLIVFFRRLANVPYYAQINGVDIQKGEAGQIEANIDLAVFVKG